MPTRDLRLPLSVLLTLTAAPLAAQDVTCDASAGGQWIGGAQDASDIATADAYAEQMALVLDGNAYVTHFELSAPAALRIEAAGRGNGDPVLTLLDTTGAERATDDDSGGNGAARIETDLEAGTYCAVVRSFDESPMTAFLRIGRTEMEPLTTGNSDSESAPEPDAIVEACAAARDLGALGDSPLSYAGTVADAGYARFTLDAPAPLSLTAENVTADPTLALYGPDGVVIAENDDFDGLNARIDLTVAQPAGSYCIGIGAISDDSLPIDVEVSLYDPAAALAGLYARGEAAPPLDGSVAITDLGALPNRVRRDLQVGSDTQWFSLTLDGPGLLLVEAIAAADDGDPWLVMYDDLGRQIAQNDDADGSTDALLSPRTATGTYLIGVKQLGDRNGFVRLAIERYIPAP